MQLAQTIVAALLAACSVTAAAAPAPRASTVKSMAAADKPLTIESVRRVCNKPDTECKWTFKINTDVDCQEACKTRTPVYFVVRASGGKPATQSNGAAQTFGNYTITSGWSGQFGPGKGFTTFAVVDNKRRLIAYPAYTDEEVDEAKLVKPDRAFPLQQLP
ncbi:uncharacterized protein MAM_06901 [Metarhizium album ARSEF 1941]|uniref:Small secreted protein n=1 Tax=Metarhizium album (strain ARSEF 1941) TaxID=1081103 RepID=A0A0B2WQC2_METAS|nr:uncharacterized protein MAM_06901 [Metarhizium album ARSEF 1941]KHN95190.1 hypothetical protein MAM_06901 [Metarhizium album ARSEF 1941]